MRQGISGQREQFLARWLTMMFTALFVGLCVMHFASLRPLWLDEQYVLNSLQEYAPSEIFGPLKNQQAFPRLHLFLIKIFAESFNDHVCALRLFSLLSMLFAFFIWLKVFRYQEKNVWGSVLWVLAWAASYRLSYYAAELKPYATDVLVVGMFLWVLYRQQNWAQRTSSWKDYLLVAVLPLSVLFSYAAFFVFWMVSYNLIFLTGRHKSWRPILGISIVMSAFALTVLYFTDLRHVMNLPLYRNYWAGSFLSINSWGGFFGPFFEGLRKLVTYWYGTEKLHIRLASGFLPLFVGGLVMWGPRMFQQDRGRLMHIESITMVIFLELLLLGILHKYPFTGTRVTLFFAPLSFYMIIKMMFSFSKIRWLQYFLIGYFVCYTLLCLGNTSYRYFALY